MPDFFVTERKFCLYKKNNNLLTMWYNNSVKYFNIEKFDSTGLVKTLMVPKDQGRWRIYFHDRIITGTDLIIFFTKLS